MHTTGNAVPEQSLRTKMVAGVLWLAAGKGLAQAITWVITLVVVRLLTPQDYGLMGMAMLFIGLLYLFNEMGLGVAMVQHPNLTSKDQSDLTWMILLVNGVLAVLLFVLAPLIGAYFREPALVAIIRVLAVTFVISGIGTPAMCMLSRQMAFRKTAQAELAGAVTGAITTLLLALNGTGVWSLVAGYLARQIVTTALYCAYSPVRLSASFSVSNVRRFLSFGGQVASSRVLWYLSSNTDSLVVGRVLGTTQLGYYALAFQFSSIPLDKLVSIVSQVAFPAFSTLQAEPERLRRYYLTLVGIVACMTFPMFLGLFLVADDAIVLLLGSRWLPVAVPLKALCLVSCFRAVETMNGPVVLATGKARIVLVNNLLQAIVMPAAFYAGSQYGLRGVSVAWIAAWPLLFAVVTSQTLTLIGLTFRDYWRELKHFVIGSMLMVVAVAALQRLGLESVPPLPRLLLSCALGVIVYLAYVGTFRRDVLDQVLRLVRRQSGPQQRNLPAEAPAFEAQATRARSGA